MKKLIISVVLIILSFIFSYPESESNVIDILINESKNTNREFELYLGASYSYINIKHQEKSVYYNTTHYNERMGLKLKIYLHKVFFKNYLNFEYQRFSINNLKYNDYFKIHYDMLTYANLITDFYLTSYEFTLLKYRNFSLSVNIGNATLFYYIYIGGSRDNKIIMSYEEIREGKKSILFFGVNIGYSIYDLFYLQLGQNWFRYDDIDGGYNSFFQGEYYIPGDIMIYTNFSLNLNIIKLSNLLKRK
ncbi:hypothetical protein KAU33_17145 [Candidatus Dependentiae bacterium]|nr:hypothetical protein [Candidatus Dependentiae bacterium]